MFRFLRNLFDSHDRPPNIAPLLERASRERDRSARIVEELEQEHQQHVAKERRRDPAEAIRNAHRAREQAR